MKTFLLMLASAFCGALFLAVGFYAWFYWHISHLAQGSAVSFPPRSESTVQVAPPIVERERFYGSTGLYTGAFSPAFDKKVLAAGPGTIVGSVTSSGKPLKGLRLRLALNGSVMSQWAISTADGRYEIAVPYGKYRVDGYELDSSVAQDVLAGKTDSPRQGHGGVDVTAVEAGRPGQGLDLAFVEPVRKLGPIGDVSVAKPITVTWESYPGAAAYRVQLIEQSDPRDYENQRRLFDWRERPIVSGTRLDLADYSVGLKKGYYYTIEIEALDPTKRALSQSTHHYDKADFRVVE